MIVICLAVFVFNVSVAIYTLTVGILISTAGGSWSSIAILVGGAMINLISATHMIRVTEEVSKKKKEKQG